MKSVLPLLALLVFLLPGTAPAQRYLWGTTSSGVSDNQGSIFKIKEDGTGYAVQYNFASDVPGIQPYHKLTLASDGNLYGTASAGGANNNGILFQYNPNTNTYQKVYDFDASTTGNHPYGGLTEVSGVLYGMTFEGGLNGYGTVFSYNISTSAFNALHHFNNTDGSMAIGSLTLASDGKLYGITSGGGLTNNGVLFSITTGGAYTKLVDFSGTNGSAPYCDLTEISGKLYGVTTAGGTDNVGVLFEFTISGSVYAKKIEFSASGTNGSVPYATLLLSGGKLYGVASGGGTNGMGTIFEYDPVGATLTKKADFSSATGGSPQGPLMKASNGLYYGLTTDGGANFSGTMYEFDLSGPSITKKVDMDQYTIGGNPINGNTLTEVSGTLYGLQAYGGPVTNGVLFKYQLSNSTYTKLVDFSNSTGGAKPLSGLVLGSQFGKLYGMTSSGGANGFGVMFEYDQTQAPSPSAFLKHVDLSTTLGTVPAGGLVEAPTTPFAKLFGMTQNGGVNGMGTIFEYNPQGDYVNKLFDFNTSSGTHPQGTMTLAADGMLYGMTNAGGGSGAGTIFQFDPQAGTFTKKADFTGTNGSAPTGDLLLATNGKLYGVTTAGGANGAGVLFEFNPATGVITKKIDFAGANGDTPRGGLTQGSNGMLYGVTSQGGSGSQGVLFVYNIAKNVLKVKHNFTGTADGASPMGSLTEVAPGTFFGTANGGGANSSGTIFKYDSISNVFTNLVDLGGTNGVGPQYVRLQLVTDKQKQTITFPAIADQAVTASPFSAGATASSGLTVSYVSSDPTVATVSVSGIITILKAGTVTITASQYGNGTYKAAMDVAVSFNVVKANQTVTFSGAMPAKTFGNAPFTVTATASSGLAVTYSSSNTAVATVNVSTGEITIVGAGSADITATQAGNANYNSASATQTLNVAKATQTITFLPFTGAYSPYVFGTGTVPLVATASSGLTVTFTSSDPTNVTISGSTATVVHRPNAGSVGISASQAGNANYLPVGLALDISNTLFISKGNQTIQSFTAIGSKKYGDAPFPLVATASSGLTVQFNTTDATVLSINNGSTPPTATIHKPGTVTVTAVQTGNGDWNAASSVPAIDQQLVTINKADQTITWTQPLTISSSQTSLVLTGTASSGLTVTYSSDNSSVATVSGSTVTIVGVGTANITAVQSGDPNYNAAPQVVRVLTVNSLQSQTITFGPLPTKAYGDVPFDLNATASSGLTVSYSSSNTSVATVSGKTVTIVGAGSTNITASQSGDATYNPASPVVQALTVSKAGQTINMDYFDDPKENAGTITVTVSATSGLPVTLTSLNPDKFTVSGNVLTILKAGSGILRATQAGNNNYSAAVLVDRAFCIDPIRPTITSPNPAANPATLFSSAANGNQWYLDGSKLTGGTLSFLTATQPGNYTVISTIENCASDVSIPFSILITGDLPLTMVHGNVYPNPVREKFFVDLSGFEDAPARLRLTDLTGRPVLEQSVRGGGPVEVSVGNQPAAIYLLTVQQDQRLLQLKVVKE